MNPKKLLESYISGLYYSLDFAWRPSALDQAVTCIVLLARRGARWIPTDRSRLNHLRKVLGQIDRSKAIDILEKFLAADVFGPGVFCTLISTPKMNELLTDGRLKIAAGQKVIVDSRRPQDRRP